MMVRAVAGRVAVAAFSFVAVVAKPGAASAFCRSSVCELGDSGALCTPAQTGDCGVALSWPERCIGFSVQSAGSRWVPAEVAARIVSDAFAVWQSADCDGAPPQFFVKRQADAACARPEYNIDFNVDEGNANVVMFRDDDWPYPEFENGFALSTLTYDIVTGEIVDVDIEINTFEVEFTTGDRDVGYDLWSTLQHETGHFLGIAHSPDIDSPMYELPEEGTTTRRKLTSDDVAAICDAYPPEGASLDAACDPTPHDFSPYCEHRLSAELPPAASAGCAISSAAASGSVSGLFCAVLGAFALVRRRREPLGTRRAATAAARCYACALPE